MLRRALDGLPKRGRPDGRRSRGRRPVALAAALAVLVLNCPRAMAAPAPRSEEWWFDAWQIRPKVWPLTEGKGVVVGLIGSGVEARLPELGASVLSGAGFDGAVRADGRADEDTESGGRGTAMAALIAARGGGTGMVGVAPSSSILPISAAVDDYARTIRYAADHGAKVINVSRGGLAAHCPADVQRAVTYAVGRDAVVVAAAGDDPLDGSSTTPANCHGVLAVGALDAYLHPWERSSPGKNVMLSAPGVAVGSIGNDGTFTWNVDGTGQAAALTSGVVALMRARFPGMSGSEVVQRMLATARDVGAKGWDEKTGYGALIPYKALTADVPKTAPNPVYDSTDSIARLIPGLSPGQARQKAAGAAERPASRGSGSTARTAWITTVAVVLAGAGATGGVFLRRRGLLRRGKT